MSDLLPYQYGLIALLFVWGGFVRSGLGFGGAVLALPFLLLILNQPLVFLPIIAIHLLLFSSLTVVQNQRKAGAERGSTVDWTFLRYALLIMAVPKLIGVFGVITLPGELISGFIFVIVSIYAMTYILDRPFKSNNKWLDHFFMILGGLCQRHLADCGAAGGAGGGQSGAQGAAAGHPVCAVVYPGVGETGGVHLCGGRPAVNPPIVVAALCRGGPCDRTALSRIYAAR